MSENEVPNEPLIDKPIVPEDNGVQDPSRRKFLTDLFRRPAQEVLGDNREADDSTNKSDRSIDAFLEKLSKVKLSRRQFVIGLGVPSAALVADQVLTKGKFLYYGIQFLTNPEFRDKLSDLEMEDLEQLARTLRSEVPPNFELGEKIESNEEWLDDSFTAQEIRAIHNTESGETRSILVADVGHVEVIEAELDEIGPGLQAVNFSRTTETHGQFVTLPTNQQSLDSRANSWVPRLYSSYQTESGVVEYKDAVTGNFNARGGALVVVDNNPLIVDSSQLNQYHIGENCQAIEVIGFVIRSNHLEQDLNDMNDSGSLAATDMVNDPRYNSFLATFYNGNNVPHTMLISTYGGSNENTEISKWENDDRLTVARALDLFEQIREERGYTRFDMQVPDPDFSLVTSSYSAENPNPIADVSSRSSLGDRFNWQYHRVLDGQANFARVNARKYFIASKGSSY